ncbi:cell division protein FtsL [Roseomonas sp. USHLN139]|uniref:cell division protein FtsL n=1 Tax=Roseomonas sp. USHLN139 TaxID=3081298 RepID=UPI003B02CF0B
MFRPLTVLAIAAFSLVGWHVYRAEEVATQLDRELRDVNKRIEVARERSQVLRAEWALLNEPERLRQVTQQHLPLETMAPAQFLRMGDLERRLPQAVAFAGPVSLFGSAPDTAVANATPGGHAVQALVAGAAIAAPAAVAVAMPAARAVAAAAQHAESRPEPVRVARAEPRVVHAPAPRPEPRQEARAVERPESRPEPRATVSLAAPRPAPVPMIAEARATPRPEPRPEPGLLRTAAHLPIGRANAATIPNGGSALGMAGGSSLAPPVPLAAPVPVRGAWNQ